MQTTQYYGLKKPEETDVATPEDFNNNMDILDGVLKKMVTRRIITLTAAGFLMCNPDGVANGKITFKAYKKPTVDFRILTEGG